MIIYNKVKEILYKVKNLKKLANCLNVKIELLLRRMPILKTLITVFLEIGDKILPEKHFSIFLLFAGFKCLLFANA